MENTKWVHDESEEGNRKAIEEILSWDSVPDMNKLPPEMRKAAEEHVKKEKVRMEREK